MGIYTATAAAMAASLIQVLLYRIKHQRYEKLHLISLGLILVLGGATLFFHNPWFWCWLGHTQFRDASKTRIAQGNVKNYGNQEF